MKLALIRVPEYNYVNENETVEKQSKSIPIPPTGLLQLGSYLKHHIPGIEIEYFDLHLLMKTKLTDVAKDRPPEEFIQSELQGFFRRFRPEIVGINCNMNSFGDGLHYCAQVVRQYLPRSVPIVVGGHYPSSFTDKVASDESIDYVVVGEGEIPFTRMLKDFETDPYLRKYDQKVINTKEVLKDYDQFPPLDYDGVRMNDYISTDNTLGTGRCAMLLTSRGCPYRCIYCATHNVWDYGFRAWPAKRMVDEIELLKSKYDIDSVVFLDDNFVLQKKRTKEFCQLLIERNIDIKWYPSSILVNALDIETVDLMIDSGCKKFVLAIESGSKRMQKIIRKNVRLDHAIKIGHHIRKRGGTFECLLIFGFPGETKADMAETMEFAREMAADWYLMGIATPLKGTEMYEICEEQNLLPAGDHTAVFREGSISTENFSKEEVEQFMWDANYRLNFLENSSYVRKKYGDALERMQNILKRYPEHFIAKFMLYKIFVDQKKTAEAQKVRKELVLLEKNMPDRVAELKQKYEIAYSV